MLSGRNSRHLLTTKCDLKIEICFGKGRKHCGKRRKMLVTNIFSISHNVYRKLLFRVAKSWDCLVKHLLYKCLLYKSLENTVGKGEIARKEKLLLCPAVFSTHLQRFLPFLSNLKLSFANPFSLEESKICRLRKG